MRQVKTLDFTGRTIFCGIDIHKKSWSVCLHDGERELKTFSQNADAEQLCHHLLKYYPNASLSIAYEAGFCGFWPHQVFSSFGLDCKVINPSDIPQPDKSRRYKTDSVDCRKLAVELGKSSLNSIHIPSQSTIEQRSLVRSRQQLVKDQTRYKNRIISFLDFYGIKIPEGYKSSTHFSQRFLSWLEQLPLAAMSKTALEVKINCVKAVRTQLGIANKELRKAIQVSPLKNNIQLLMTIPGVGIQSAWIIATELEDIHRFKNFDQLASYAGFKPDIYSSGEHTVNKGITRQCNHLVRETLVECSWMAVGKDPALTQAYYDFKKRMHYNKAILRIAKKLLARIRFVLIHEKPYELGKVE
ncbi:MAG TPA: IS110 family transposase [Chitinophagaceae bacterium]|jgi:transposase